MTKGIYKFQCACPLALVFEMGINLIEIVPEHDIKLECTQHENVLIDDYRLSRRRRHSHASDRKRATATRISLNDSVPACCNSEQGESDTNHNIVGPSVLVGRGSCRQGGEHWQQHHQWR